VKLSKSMTVVGWEKLPMPLKGTAVADEMPKPAISIAVKSPTKPAVYSR